MPPKFDPNEIKVKTLENIEIMMMGNSVFQLSQLF